VGTGIPSKTRPRRGKGEKSERGQVGGRALEEEGRAEGEGMREKKENLGRAAIHLIVSVAAQTGGLAMPVILRGYHFRRTIPSGWPAWHRKGRRREGGRSFIQKNPYHRGKAGCLPETWRPRGRSSRKENNLPQRAAGGCWVLL